MDLSNKKILISIPCRDNLSVGFVETLMQLMKPCQCCYRFGVSGLVFDARDEAAQVAINNGYDYVLYIDSDMLFAPDALIHLLQHDADVATGLYFKRKGNHEPVICKRIDRRYDEDGKCVKQAIADTETDIDRDIFEVEACGFGFCLVKTATLKKVMDKYVSCFEPISGMGEDYSFCYRCKEMGIKIICDTRFWLGHMGAYVYDRKDFIEVKIDG